MNGTTPGVVERTVRVSVFAAFDYDSDDDGLIEVRTLGQLDAIRSDPDGDGVPVAGSENFYQVVSFPNAVAGMGCPEKTGSDPVEYVCTGYELFNELDFDTDESGDANDGDIFWDNGKGWAGIGRSSGEEFATVFDGNGYAIRNLYINRTTSSDNHQGLFAKLTDGGVLRNVNLVDVNVKAYSNVGALVGLIEGGQVTDSRATGTVYGVVSGVGGLVGVSGGDIIASYAVVHVTGPAEGSAQYRGGLLGQNSTGGKVVASYSTGVVDRAGGDSVGGLIGANTATVTASYWDTTTSGTTSGGSGNGGVGKTTTELQSPTGYTGIYAGWNVDTDGVTGGDDPWQFGGSTQYPILSWEAARAPGKPQGLTAAAGNQRVILTWADPSDSNITRYEYSVDSGSWTEVPSSGATTTNYTATDLTNGTSYTFRVRAVNAGGDGAASASVTATPVPGDAALLTLSKAAITVAEASAGNTAIYTVKLNAQPTGDVTVTLTSGDTSVATVSPASLTFTQSDWSTAQTVTVTGADDDIDNDGRTTSISHTASGGGYGSATGSVGVNLTDNDPDPTATLKLTPASIGENGGVSTVTEVDPKIRTGG